ncbi:metal-sulfur cluster assembly factor [Ignisphaera sp. 4213-co]|uniref:Metal-sulfur cluster assembly factor n=1 Tax=Ignisphaera cupida TaxID=3050454 RepID=A0ABD4Z7B0_9CREN|nr:metal-sulfur cluster assembly factor [Ignisphaera sp. 4213-co]MDK6029090.1 metal-sulfur cluster assembly factor [Ignisphaera sp. 4213-co]
MTSTENETNEIKRKVVEVLRNVYDPEIPINVYDLGLVYSIDIDKNKIVVVLGLTSPFCPIAHLVVKQAEDALRNAFPDMEIHVELDLERVWNPSMMTEEGKKLFKILYGYDPSELMQK